MKHLLLFSFADQMHHWKGLLVVIFVGGIIGALIAFLLRNFRSLGILFSAALGMVGAWACQSFMSQYFTFAKGHLMNEIICAAAGALVVCLVLNLALGSNKGKDRTMWRA